MKFSAGFSLVLFGTVVLASILDPARSFAANEILNQEALRQKMGMNAYPSGNSLSTLKIAILDNGFAGYEPGKGMLPDSAEFVAGPTNPPLPTPHGLGMAQIVWTLLGRPVLGPKFYLINSNGYSNLQAAAQFVINHHVDIVLYSEVWTFGDNFDGRGFINALVSSAVHAGTVWINAAGNYGGMTYTGAVVGHPDAWHFTNSLDENNVTVTLSWSDFTDSEHYPAVKDLDLYVYDANGKLVGSSELVQHGAAPPATGYSNLSAFAREVVALPHLDRGDYSIQVKAKSTNFTATDRLRLVINSDQPGAVVFPDHAGSEVLPPADNPDVITVGERTALSSMGGVIAGHVKPDVLVDDATVSFSNGSSTAGSSNAAAMVAAAVVALREDHRGLDSAHLERYLQGLQTPAQLPNADLLPIATSAVNPWVFSIAPAGSTVMIERNGHLVVLSPIPVLEIPIFKNAGAALARPDDILVISPVNQHWYSVPRVDAAQIVAPMIEFRQVGSAAPAGAPGVWSMPTLAQLLALLSH